MGVGLGVGIVGGGDPMKGCFCLFGNRQFPFFNLWLLLSSFSAKSTLLFLTLIFSLSIYLLLLLLILSQLLWLPLSSLNFIPFSPSLLLTLPPPTPPSSSTTYIISFISSNPKSTSSVENINTYNMNWVEGIFVGPKCEYCQLKYSNSIF